MEYLLIFSLGPIKFIGLMILQVMSLAHRYDKKNRETEWVYLTYNSSPAKRASLLIDDLLSWFRNSQEHPLISSCVFH